MDDASDFKVRFRRHVLELLQDDRLRIDTALGRKAVCGLLPETTETGSGVDVKVNQKKWLSKTVVGRFVATFVDKLGKLVTGDVQKIASETTGAAGAPRGVPTTIVIASAAGFELTAHEQADRRSDRTIILVEPNGLGGFNVYGPTETKALNDLFDPETTEEKRTRLHAQITAAHPDYAGTGLGADKLVAATKLPLVWVENEFRTYAGSNSLVAKRVGGTLTLMTHDNPLAAKQEGPLA